MSEAREGRLDDAAELVEVVAYLELFMHPECYADLADMGVDVTLYDELLATLGYDHTVASYVEEGRGWIHANSAVIMVNDDELLENSIRWSEAELGSDEELVAVNEFLIRLVHVTLLHETVSSGSRPRDGHPTTGGDNCVPGSPEIVRQAQPRPSGKHAQTTLDDECCSADHLGRLLRPVPAVGDASRVRG